MNKEELKKKSSVKICHLCSHEIDPETIEPIIIKTKRGSTLCIHPRCYHELFKNQEKTMP